jgi:MoxR-like ATPase
VRAVLHPCLRHRVILGFEGEAERVRIDSVLDRIIEAVAVEGPGKAKT